MPGSQQNVAGVFNLRPATTYHLRIVAENEIGTSDPSDTVTIITAEEAPSGPPSSVRVDALDQHTLKVRELGTSIRSRLRNKQLHPDPFYLLGNLEATYPRRLERRNSRILRRIQAVVLRETLHVRNSGILQRRRKGTSSADHEPKDLHPVQRRRTGIQQGWLRTHERGTKTAHCRGRTRTATPRHDLHYIDFSDRQNFLGISSAERCQWCHHRVQGEPANLETISFVTSN